MEIGDETYYEEFEVYVEISSIFLTEGLTADSGIFVASENKTYWILFVNKDINLKEVGILIFILKLM